ncbi:MAG: hypothetical protein ACRDYF_10240 [Acidimicrobiia bacterium]
MRALLTTIAATTIAATTAGIGLAWPSGAVEPASAAAASLPQPMTTRLELLGCQVTDLPPKDLSKLPEIECR